MSGPKASTVRRSPPGFAQTDSNFGGGAGSAGESGSRLAPGREQITRRHTKNGEDVAAALHSWARERLREYAERRGMIRRTVRMIRSRGAELTRQRRVSGDREGAHAAIRRAPTPSWLAR
jgi:hypothetical protein